MKKTIAIILVIMTLATTALADGRRSAGMEYFDTVREYIQEEYKFEATTEELYKNALNELLKEYPKLMETAILGMTKELDDYSRYMTYDEFSAWIYDLEGAFVGIGVTIEERNGYVTVIEPIEDSPAIRAGIQAEDRIVEVDGVSVIGKGIEYTRSLVLGEEGTEVTVGIMRDGETVYFTMKRAPVKQTTVSYDVTDGIGYLAISQFALTTFDDVKAALADFDKKGINKIIIDLRNNPGGEKQSVIDVMSLFMPTGAVLNIEYKEEIHNEIISVTNENYGKYETVLLVNEYSASASEVFAGTYKDRKVGTIIGETTYGKGTIQNIQPISTGGALKLTVATYKTGGGNEVNGIGIKPDIEIRNTICPLYENTDIEKIEFAQMIDENSSEDTIYAVELRLSLAGVYPGKIDGIFDSETKAAISVFQEKNEIPVTGSMDLTTQVYLDNATRDIPSVIDDQLNKALEILK